LDFGGRRRDKLPACGMKKLVAGAGFEPAVRQLPDYELARCKRVIV